MKIRLNKHTLDEAIYQGPGGCYLWDTELDFNPASAILVATSRSLQ